MNVFRVCLQRYNTTRHDYELTLDDHTLVELADDEGDTAIPRVIYHVRWMP